MASKLKIGLVADIHYARHDDGSRLCSAGLQRLAAAISEFRRRSVDLVLLLGDATDGGEGREIQLACVDEVAEALADAPGDVLFVAGNHDLADISKKEFHDCMWSTLAFPHDAMTYEYSYAVDRGGFRFIFLDTHFTEDGRDWAAGNFSWEEPYVRSDHLAWAARVAAGAPDAGVILVVHENVDYRETDGRRDPFVLVNHRSTWDAISHGEDDLIRAAFQGHYHPGRLSHVRGAPIVTLSAMAERSATAFAIAEIDAEAMSIRGYGRQHGAQILLSESVLTE